MYIVTYEESKRQFKRSGRDQCRILMLAVNQKSESAFVQWKTREFYILRKKEAQKKGFTLTKVVAQGIRFISTKISLHERF